MAGLNEGWLCLIKSLHRLAKQNPELFRRAFMVPVVLILCDENALWQIFYRQLKAMSG